MENFVDASEMLRGGVYALLYRREVVYIGKAKRMLTRVYSHLHIWGQKRKGGKSPTWSAIDGIYFDQVFIRPCHPDEVDRVERELIALYKPRLNTKLTSGPSSAPFSIKVGNTTLHLNQKPVIPVIERRV